MRVVAPAHSSAGSGSACAEGPRDRGSAGGCHRPEDQVPARAKGHECSHSDLPIPQSYFEVSGYSLKYHNYCHLVCQQRGVLNAQAFMKRHRYLGSSGCSGSLLIRLHCSACVDISAASVARYVRLTGRVDASGGVYTDVVELPPGMRPFSPVS